MQIEYDFISFKNHEYISISTPKLMEELFRYDSISITFHGSGKASCYILYNNDFAIMALEDLRSLLNRVAKGELKLHKSIDKDIGYLWNEYLTYGQMQSLAYCKSKEGQTFWLGEENLLWSMKGIASWIYEKDNKIFFEITPTYPWLFTDLRKVRRKKEYFTYKEFMQNYQPYIIREVDKSKIEEWLAQTEKLLQQIIENDNKYRDILDAMPVYKLSPQTGQNNN